MRHFFWIVPILAFILIAALLSFEGAVQVFFGWIPFLIRVIPQLTVDGPSVVVGALAFVLFAILLHRMCRAYRLWTVRSSSALVAGVVILFAAGVSVVGMTHQLAWLATSEQPMQGEALMRDGGHPLNQTKKMGMALVNHNESNAHHPSGGTFTSDGQMLHSWETQILPFIGYSTFGIDMNRPWNDPKNQPFFKGPLSAFINPGFRNPSLEDDAGFGLSHYASNSRLLGANTKTRLTEIPDGASNTIAIGEVNAAFQPWGHPVNWRDPAIGLNAAARGFGGPPGSRGVYFVMADGSVRFVTNRTDPTVLRVLSTPNGGEPIPDDATTKLP